MTFYDDNTVLILNSNIANICDYEILNDSLIGFTEAGYYRTNVFSIDGDRMTLKLNLMSPCLSGTSSAIQGEMNVQHFYRQ